LAAFIVVVAKEFMVLLAAFVALVAKLLAAVTILPKEDAIVDVPPFFPKLNTFIA